MAANTMGSTFILAERAITNIDHNDKKTTAAPRTTSGSTKSASIAGALKVSSSSIDDVSKKKPYKIDLVWRNILLFLILHSAALYGLYLIYAEKAYLESVFGLIFISAGCIGICAGVHRLWCHRTYKAKAPLRIFLMLCQSLSFQNSIHEWSRDHRVHHKFTDTDADPHNSARGYFFAHMGWLLCKKHPDVKEKGKQIDLSDLEADPVVMFQKKYYFILMPICAFVLPTLIPYYLCGCSLKTCFFVCSALRYCLSLHFTWLVNSAAHFHGMKPYDKHISPVNNKWVSILTYGEGWHNYHHVFPWDYKADEFGNCYNIATRFLNLMAKFGQAYDLRTVSDEMILKRIQRTGDGTHHSCTTMTNNLTSGKCITPEMLANLDHKHEETLTWGWEDKDFSEEDRMCANIIHKKDD